MLVVTVFVLHIVTVWCEPNNLQEIDMQALGRPFALGDLYDRNRDYIIDGPKIWTHEELRNYVQTESHSEEFDVKASQSINEEMSYFDLGASLKMSFLSGLVSVSGAASYMDHRKKKNNVARVSLKYKSTTFVRELKSDLFNKVSLPHVLKNAEEATDVVYKIQYGAGAIFSFEKTVKENECTKDIEGELQVVVKKVPQFQIDAKGHVKISDEDRKKGENLSCTFFGDFILKTHPGTYEEAIRVYKTINATASSVPVKVWLYPLEKLPISKSHMDFHRIQDSMINDVTDVLSELEKNVREANDILASVVGNHHERIRIKVQRFHDYVKRYAVLFKQKLWTTAPKVRKGELSSKGLTKMIDEKEASPFNKDKLQRWIDEYKKEVIVLTANHDNLGGFSDYCGIEGDFSARLLRKVRYTVGLTLKLDSMYSPYLDELDKHLLAKELTLSEQSLKKKHKKWWDPTGPILAKLSALSTSFGDCYRLRVKKKMLANSGVQFIVREVTLAGPNDEPGISIELYDQGVLKDKNYALTSPPSLPVVTSKTHNSITLKWNKPEEGVQNLKGFKVTTYVPKDSHTNMTDCSFFGSICEISSTLSSSTSATIRGLSPLSRYYFTVSAYTHIGETSISETTQEVLTTDCSPGSKRTVSHECESCPSGTYSDQPGVTSCAVCPPGTFNPKYGARSKKECISCPAGTFNSKAGSRHLKDCTPCSRGFFSSKLAAADEKTCQKCPMGTYSSELGTTKCIKCNTDSYSPTNGANKCLKCPTGTESKVEGATSKSQCLSLDPVTTLDRKINAVHTIADHKYSEMNEQVMVTGKGVDAFQKTIDDKEKDVSHQITENWKGLEKKFDTILGCDWMKGEGVSELQPIHVPGITSRESCIYNCFIVQKKKFSRINGVSRKLSSGDCHCLLAMKSKTAPSSRYEACLF